MALVELRSERARNLLRHVQADASSRFDKSSPGTVALPVSFFKVSAHNLFRGSTSSP
jgi:hypothetical protein